MSTFHNVSSAESLSNHNIFFASTKMFEKKFYNKIIVTVSHILSIIIVLKICYNYYCYYYYFLRFVGSDGVTIKLITDKIIFYDR